MGKKKHRTVELNLHGESNIYWAELSGRNLYAEIIIGETTYLYLTETEYRDLESRVLEKQ